MSQKQIYYSDKYDDEKFEYRHVMLPKDIAKRVPKTHLMSETEWRNLGVQQSQGWIHYMIHQPEANVSEAGLYSVTILLAHAPKYLCDLEKLRSVQSPARNHLCFLLATLPYMPDLWSA
uniref:Cyclin-dependent kinases regulatory subunit n=1 Tax=Hucho hucho TaxID=62062 RepID=A0A4W5MTP0_9TELE